MLTAVYVVAGVIVGLLIGGVVVFAWVATLLPRFR